MTVFLLIGSSIGAVIGFLHACYVYRQEVRDLPNVLSERPVATRVGAAYYALWTFFLWVVFGSYVLILWVVSVIAYSIYKAVRISSTS